VSQLFDAMRAADHDVPGALASFDAIVAPAADRPDFHEHSMRLGPEPRSWRLTYYFDVHRRGGALAREAGSRFARLCRELKLEVPAPVDRLVRGEAPERPEVLQVVLGIELGATGEDPRCKYYLVFRDDPGESVATLLSDLELTAPEGADPRKVYILGLDLTRSGLEDAKLYFRLALPAVARAMDLPEEATGLLAASRGVVFQQCTVRPARRQAYFHMSSSAPLASWLATHGHADALKRAAAIDAKLERSRLEPWILAFPCTGRRLETARGTVYFHVVDR
jgi:hypothetical protein